MKFTVILTIVILLSSCGGRSSNDTPVSNLDPNAIHIKIVKSTGNSKFDGPPLEGVLLQLGHDGINVRTDKNGVAKFDITDANEHDIHVFGENGFRWESIYNIKKGILNKIQLFNPDDIAPRPQDQQPQKTSYVAFSGTISNYNPSNTYLFIFYNNLTGKEYQGNTIKPSENFQVTFTFNVPTNTEVTGKLLVLETQYDIDTATGLPREAILVDSEQIPLNTYITSATKDNYLSQDILLSNADNKPLQTDIITINKMPIPTGFTSSNIYLDQEYDINSVSDLKPRLLLNYTSIKNMAFPKTFQSHTPYDYSTVSYFIFSEKITLNSTLQWNINGEVSRYASININPNITVFPSFPENQTGSSIDWNSIADNLSHLNLVIKDIVITTQSPVWNIRLPTNAITIQLPIIPTEIKPILVNKKNYLMLLDGGIKNNNIIEHFKIRYEGWTR